MEISLSPNLAPIQSHKRLIVLGLFSVLLIFIGSYFFLGTQFSFVGGGYEEVYALVNNKVSQSAAVVVSLPNGVSKEGVEKLVKFEPELLGKWVDSKSEETIAFLPSKKLEVGMHYSVTLSTPSGDITKDFLIDENPQVLEVFPREDSEADENSAVTIVFNRPMVPLTRLDKLDTSKLPIQITPVTEGVYKWISTRTLQFIPKNRLHYSSNYSVKILPGFASSDGVSVPAKEYKFATRPIRAELSKSGTILYNEPIGMRFNVPINLERTASALHLTDTKTGISVPFTAEYGKRLVNDANGKPKEVVIDRKVLAIYPKADSNGRARVWNFSGSYSAVLDNAYPLDGDISLNQKITSQVSITEVIKSVTAKSERTSLASVTLFDPQGSLSVLFHEDLDIRKTKVEMRGVREIRYGEKCKENVGAFKNWGYGNDCEKVENKAELIFTFNPGEFLSGETVPLTFEKVVNADGLIVNDNPITLPVNVYPKFAISQAVPAVGVGGESLSVLYICSNTPVVAKTKANFKESLITSSYMVFNRFDQSYLRQNNDYYGKNVPCKVGEYVTVVHYGLHPDSDYLFSLRLTDVFGQSLAKELNFHTGQPESFYRRFGSLQKIYNVTTPDHTKFVYFAENLESMNLHICKTSPSAMIQYLNEQPGRNVPGSSLSCFDSRTSVVKLPSRFWVNNYFDIDLKTYFTDPLGQYIISWSNPNYVDGRGVPIVDRTYVSVTNLAVGAKKTQWTKYDTLSDMTKTTMDKSGSSANLIWVVNSKSLEPIFGASVAVYQKTGESEGSTIFADSGQTNGSGIAEFGLIKDVAGVTVTSGNDSALISSWTDNMNYAGSAYGNRMLYTYTDRPIYRPGQDVFIKGIYRFQFDGNYEIFRDKEIPVQIFNPRGEKVLEQTLSLNNFGTFTTKFVLPPDSALGTYYINVLNHSAYFDVEEYKASAFEITASVPKEEYVAGDTADISVVGKYYFGVPLSGGSLDYTFTAQDFYFDRYTDEYFNFGGGWYGCYSCGYGDSYIGGGKTELDSVGNAKVSFKLDFAKLFRDDARDKSKILVFHGTIKDVNGKSVSVEKSFIVHRGQYYIGAKVEPYFTPTNQEVRVRVKTVDTDGKPVGRGSIKLTANKIEWKSVKRQEVDGGFYDKWERVVTKITEKSVSTDSRGDDSVALSFSDPGEYEISLKGSDGNDNEITAVTSLYVYGAGVASVKPNNNATLDITAEKKNVVVGEKAKIVIKSPYPHAKALITVERGRIFKYDVVTIDRSFYEYEVPIEDGYAPNIFVSALLLSPSPEVKFGQVEFKVDAGRKALNIEVTPNKTYYLPGEQVVLKIKTTNYLGQPESADVSLAVADLSVLALKGNPKKNPLVFFYNGLPLTVTTASNIKNILMEVDIPTGTKGGGGGDAEDLATRKRGEFKDTAFWQGQLITDKNGQGEVTFKLPDNLTRWQVESVGVTEDTKVGVNYKEITASKRVMAVPLAPRFIIPGDEFSIGVQVFNQTENKQELSVSLQSNTLELKGSSQKNISIKSGESKTLYFEVSAPKGFESGNHIFTLSAKNDNFNDTVEGTIPVKRNMTYESTATAGTVTSGKVVEYVYVPGGLLTDRGGVTVRAQASLSVFLKDALSYLAQFPYGCSEQMASKLSMLATLKKVNKLNTVAGEITIPPVEFDGKKYSLDEAVSMGLSRIYETQDYSGGFSYYQGLKPDINLSVYIINALQDLKEAGFAIRDNALSSAKNYVAKTLATKGLQYYKEHPYELDSLVTAVYALSRGGGYVESLDTVKNYLATLATTEYINEKISSNALPYLAELTYSDGAFSYLQSKVWSSLENRISIDSRGAYLKANNQNVQYGYYETPVKNTALAIKAFSTTRRANSQIDNMIRWLIASRDKDGAWGSTASTLAVIDAMTIRMNETGDAKTNFTIDLKIDGEKQATHEFAGKNIFEPFEKFLPIAGFSVEKNHQLSLEVPATSAKPSRFYYDLGFTYYLPVEKVSPRDEGIAIERSFYSLTDTKKENPLHEAKVGDVLLGEIKIITPKPRPLFAVEGYIPAGMELVNFNLDTEDQSVIEGGNVVKGAVGSSGEYRAMAEKLPIIGSLMSASVSSSYDGLPEIYQEDLDRKNNIQTLYPDFSELRDDRLFLFKQNLPAGEYIYKFYVRATTPGEFRALPAVAKALYFPEIFGRTGGEVFKVVH